MKKTLLVLLFFNSHSSFAQNLVQNPSFEDTISCPTSIDQLFKAINWYSFRDSPEYFHECDNPINGAVGVPENSFGYQYPHSGSAYAGIIPYDFDGAPY